MEAGVAASREVANLLERAERVRKHATEFAYHPEVSANLTAFAAELESQATALKDSAQGGHDLWPSKARPSPKPAA